jgi:predicted transcriptional regulator
LTKRPSSKKQAAKRRHRSKEEIYAAMLKVALESVPKTRIMYGAYVSSKMLNEYLQDQLKKGLVEYNREGKVYRATTTGRKYLQDFASLGI